MPTWSSGIRTLPQTHPRPGASAGTQRRRSAIYACKGECKRRLCRARWRTKTTSNRSRAGAAALLCQCNSVMACAGCEFLASYLPGISLL